MPRVQAPLATRRPSDDDLVGIERCDDVRGFQPEEVRRLRNALERQFVAFGGALPGGLLASVIVSNYVFKTGIEVLFTPATYAIVKFLKKKESEDHYDYGVNYNPFKVEM